MIKSDIKKSRIYTNLLKENKILKNIIFQIYLKKM